jgi:hypothetical protein
MIFSMVTDQWLTFPDVSLCCCIWGFYEIVNGYGPLVFCTRYAFPGFDDKLWHSDTWIWVCWTCSQQTLAAVIAHKQNRGGQVGSREPPRPCYYQSTRTETNRIVQRHWRNGVVIAQAEHGEGWGWRDYPRRRTRGLCKSAPCNFESKIRAS